MLMQTSIADCAVETMETVKPVLECIIDRFGVMPDQFMGRFSPKGTVRG